MNFQSRDVKTHLCGFLYDLRLMKQQKMTRFFGFLLANVLIEGFERQERPQINAGKLFEQFRNFNLSIIILQQQPEHHKDLVKLLHGLSQKSIICVPI